MPLVKLQLTPGINRESTALANERQWFEADKVRFRSGYPEKLGGWVKDLGSCTAVLQPPAGAFWGVCRSMWNWATLSGDNLLSVGTNLKFYIQQSTNGNVNDVTPLRKSSTVAANAFTTTNGSATVVVNDAGHGAQDGDFVTISGVAGAVNGVPAADLNQEFRLTYLSSGTYSISVTTPATSSGTTGACTLDYQISTGQESFAFVSGFGAGGFGGVTPGAPDTGWGEAASGGSVGVQMRLWSQGNYGQDLIINPRGGGLYLWKVGTPSSVFDRAVLLSSTSASPYTTDAECPSVANGVMVSDASRFVIAFGCNDIGGTTQDPMLVRWGDQESYATWLPAAGNQAGSYRLSIGSSIISWEQTRQEILIWTDAALYSMQYTGYPFFWGFNLLASNTSVVGPNAHATAGNTTFWMGVDKFYAYNGRVQPLPCTLRQYVFGDINIQQGYQFFAGTNEGFNEVWFFYCSSGSTTVDRYVIYNYVENTWCYGTMARTAWLDTALRMYPMGAGYDGQLIYHESGTDDGTTNPPSPITAYVQSGDIDISDGQKFGFVWRMLPDITFDGSSVNQPAVTFTLKPRRTPGSPYFPESTPSVTSAQDYRTTRTYTVQQFTPAIYVRVRGRVMAFRVESTGLGVQWQLGRPSLDVRQDGQR